MSFRVTLREFGRHLYARIFGSFGISKTILNADLLLCDERGFPLLNIRCRKCEYMLHYTKNDTGLSVIVYDANFCPHAFRISATGKMDDIILRDDPQDTRLIGRMHIFEEKASSVVFYGPIEEVHALHVGDRHVIAGAPVMEVSDKYLDDVSSADASESQVQVTDKPGSVRFLPLITYTGKGYVHK